METLHPTQKHGALAWDRNLLPPILFEDRYRRLQSAIAEFGDDGWLVYGDAARAGDLAWITHYAPPVRTGLAFVPRSGPPTLLAALDPGDAAAIRPLTWVEDVRLAADLTAPLAALLAERGLERAQLGSVALDRIAVAGWDAVAGALPGVRWERRDDAMQSLRPSRHLAERNAVRRAGNSVERGFVVARHVLRAGIAMHRAIALIEREIRREGAEDVRILVAAGEQAGEQLRPPDDRVLRQGDIVLLYVAAQTQRVWAEAAQTLVLGSIPPHLHALTMRAWRAVVGMEANARPDARVAQVVAAAQKTIANDALWSVACRYGLGHATGLEAEEAPAIAPGVDAAIAREAVFAFRVVLHDGPIGAIAGGSYLILPRESVPLVEHPALVECTT